MKFQTIITLYLSLCYPLLSYADTSRNLSEIEDLLKGGRCMTWQRANNPSHQIPQWSNWNYKEHGSHHTWFNEATEVMWLKPRSRNLRRVHFCRLATFAKLFLLRSKASTKGRSCKDSSIRTNPLQGHATAASLLHTCASCISTVCSANICLNAFCIRQRLLAFSPSSEIRVGVQNLDSHADCDHNNPKQKAKILKICLVASKSAKLLKPTYSETDYFAHSRTIQERSNILSSTFSSFQENVLTSQVIMMSSWSGHILRPRSSSLSIPMHLSYSN